MFFRCISIAYLSIAYLCENIYLLDHERPGRQYILLLVNNSSWYMSIEVKHKSACIKLRNCELLLNVCKYMYYNIKNV